MAQVLVHSPDDEKQTGKGWYWEDRRPGGAGWPISQLFATEEEAQQAQKDKTITWIF